MSWLTISTAAAASPVGCPSSRPIISSKNRTQFMWLSVTLCIFNVAVSIGHRVVPLDSLRVQTTRKMKDNEVANLLRGG